MEKTNNKMPYNLRKRPKSVKKIQSTDSESEDEDDGKLQKFCFQ